MPYIKQDRRVIINDHMKRLEQHIKTPGELNYAVSHLCAGLLHEKGTSYTKLNEIIGALECVQLELYRRVAAPYEDIKIKENGDVY